MWLFSSESAVAPGTERQRQVQQMWGTGDGFRRPPNRAADLSCGEPGRSAVAEKGGDDPYKDLRRRCAKG